MVENRGFLLKVSIQLVPHQGPAKVENGLKPKGYGMWLKIYLKHLILIHFINNSVLQTCLNQC